MFEARKPANTCGICGKETLHGSHLGGQGGTYLGESGCHDGVWMDDDEYGEASGKDGVHQRQVFVDPAKGGRRP